MNDGVPSLDDLANIVEAPTGGQAEQSEELESIDQQCLHFVGGSEFDEPLRLRKIKELSREDYNELEGELQGVVGRYLRAIGRQKFEATKKYISNVILIRDDQHRGRVLDRFREGPLRYPGKLFIWVNEGDHIHVIHDCPQSNGTCRCKILQGDDFRGPVRSTLRRKRFIDELDEIDWINVLLYFIVSKWSCHPKIWIGGRLQGSPSSDEIIRWKHLQTKSRQILARQDQGNGRNSSGEFPVSEDSRESFQSGTGSSRQKRSATGEDRPGKKTKYERILSTVHTILELHHPVPPTHMMDLIATNPRYAFMFDPSNQKCIERSIYHICKLYNTYTLAMFRDLYEGQCPVFYSANINPFEYYHDRATSFEFVEKLLLHQFNYDEEELKRFLTNIPPWFNKQGWEGNIKCNALAIIGPHNCGKNYFWDIIAAIAFNTGHIGRVNNRTNTFALQDIPSRRCVIGNEVSMEEGAKEDFKKMCEGAAFNVKVKHVSDAIFTKCPVILISNVPMDICYDPIFKDVRLKTFFWTPCEDLKDSNKKPYPMCLFDLFDKYNVSIN